MLWLLIFFCVGASVVLLSQVLLPVPLRIYHQTQEKKAQEASKKLENLFLEVERKKITFVFIIVPLLFAGTGFFFFQNPIGAIAGAAVGLVLPNIFIRIWEKRRRQKFETQLLDSLLVLSGSLKAGLSLLQSLEVLVEDTAPPLSQEFGLLLKEVKMGMSLEESMHRLSKRMPSEELTMLISSILVAQETGGDITKVFSRLAATMRHNRKLKDNVKTLTLQGRMQGIIMSILPFIFIWWVLTFNRQHFDILLQSETGRMLLMIAVVLQAIGLFLIYKFSIIKI
jgi:tight adherence protein B